jgi:hypothetical protein
MHRAEMFLLCFYDDISRNVERKDLRSKPRRIRVSGNVIYLNCIKKIYEDFNFM